MTRIIISCFLAFSALAVSLAGCSSSAIPKDQVTLQVNWFHAAEFVGYYVAEAKGFYDDENLSVTIKEGGPGIQARESILTGQADFAIASFNEQKTLIMEGEPSVAVMAVFQIPPLVLFALTDSGIDVPEDMVGKTIGIKNNYWRDIVRTTLSNAGIDPSRVIEVDVEANAQYLLYDGEVDVWLGYAHDEPVSARMAGYPVTTIYPADYGVGGYEGLLLTNSATINNNADLVDRFVRSSQKGLQYALEHPDEAALIITRWQNKESLDFYKLSVQALIPLVDVPQADIGSINPKRWEILMGDSYDPAYPGYTTMFLEEK